MKVELCICADHRLDLYSGMAPETCKVVVMIEMGSICLMVSPTAHKPK